MAAILKYKLPNVSTLNELYEKYPDGGEYGWFAYVATLAKYAYWETSTGLWQATDELPVQPANPATPNPDKVEITDIPVLKYLKDPATTLNELVERYPDGGEYGWFAFIEEDETFAWWNTKLTPAQWKLIKGGEGGGTVNPEDVTYTNENPSVIAVGGIAVGTTFDKKTMQEMWDMALYPEQNPTLTEPSYILTASPSAQFQKVGAEVNYLFSNQFNTGTINPLYQLNETTGKWEATPNYPRVGYYSFEGEANGYKTIALGANTWQRTVTFAAGVQPKTNKGNDYDGPYAAGEITASKTVYGVYPVLATKTSTTPEELALQAHGSTITGINVMAGVAVIQIPEIWFSNWAAVKIWQYDTNSGQYKVIDRSSFAEETIDIAGVAYKQFTSTETLGARIIQFSA